MGCAYSYGFFEEEIKLWFTKECVDLLSSLLTFQLNVCRCFEAINATYMLKNTLII